MELTASAATMLKHIRVNNNEGYHIPLHSSLMLVCSVPGFFLAKAFCKRKVTPKV